MNQRNVLFTDGEGPRSILFAHDFDSTIADSEKLAPGIPSVPHAYDKAIRNVFGREGSEIYAAIGGFQNIAPSALVQRLLALDPRENLMQNARGYYDSNPHGVYWDGNPVTAVTELLVAEKVRILLDLVGTTLPDGSPWPQPTRGFLNYWSVLRQLQQEGVPLTIGIISSGNRAFVQRVLAMWGVPEPDILVTEDDIRWRRFPESLGRRVKPGVLPLAIAHQQWLALRGLSGTNFSPDTAWQDKKYMIYFGDAPSKDGAMAHKGGISYGQYQEGAELSICSDDFMVFGDWGIIADLLRQRRNGLQEGRPLRELFGIIPTTRETRVPAGNSKERL